MTTNTTPSNLPIVFILDNVADYASMAQGLYANSEVHVLSADGDALAQMASILDGRTGIDAIHLVSHGQAGELELGTVSLNSGNLSDYSASLSVIQASLSQNADFLIYGCDVAQGEVGQAFVNALADATGADIAASNDTTGPASSGSDADLEVQTGSIEAASLDQSNFHSDLGTDSALPTGLSSAPYEWNGYTFQTRIDGEITSSDPENPMRLGNMWDRYVLDGVTDGTVVSVYMGNSSTVDDYLQISRGGVVITETDDTGSGERGYDAFVTWTYQAGDVIHATTYSGDLGTYSLYIGTDTGAVAQPTDIGDAPAPEPTSAPTFTDGFGLLATLTDTAGVDAFSDITGTLTASDATPNGQVFSGGGTSDYGDLTVAANGDFTFAPNVAAINALVGGATQTLTFAVNVTDDGGLSSSKDLTIDLVGANDAPLITNVSGDLAIAEIPGGTSLQVTGSMSGSFGVNDVDAPSAQDEAGVVFGLPEGGTDDGGAVYAVGQYGTLYLSPSNGDYTFVANETQIEALAGGQVVTDVYQVSATDALGATGVGSFTVTLTGSNDAPTIALDWPFPSLPTLTEASGVGNASPGTSYANLGVLLSDAEGTAQFDMSALHNDGWVAVDGTSFMSHEGAYGSAQLDLSNGALTYTLSNASVATQQLNVGDQMLENFNVSVVDAQGATATTMVSFEINGADDAPEIHVDSDPKNPFFIDGNGDLQINYNHTGHLSVTDVDTDVLTYGQVSFGVAGGFTDDGGNSIHSGGFGLLVVNSASGQLDYVGNPQAINLVAPGDTAYDTFTLTMSNESGLMGTYAYEVAIVGPVQVEA